MKKIIAVVGATGSQGSGLVRAILADQSGEFAVRAIVTNAQSDKALALAALGAEVVQANLDNPESMRRAFEGCYGAYCVTFFWNHFQPELEMTHARTMASVARAAGVKHVIWSTLEDTRKLMSPDDDRMPMLQFCYRVPHFDGKNEANSAFDGLPVTFLNTSFYWDNAYMFGMGPAKQADGTYTITFPMGDKRMAGIAKDDIGKCAFGIFKNPDKYIGKTVGIAGEFLTGAQMAEKYSAGLGIVCKYNEVPADVYRKFGFPGCEDLGNMFQVYRDFETEVIGARNLDESRSLNPELQTFDQWLTNKKQAILGAMAAAEAAAAEKAKAPEVAVEATA